MDSPILSHDSRHKPGESRTSSRPGRPAVSGSFITHAESPIFAI